MSIAVAQIDTTKPRRRKPSQERAHESVAAILEASALVLQHYGYKRTTTNRIAERAGVSVGTLYQYFRNKDEIFNALIERESQHYLHAVAAAMPGTTAPLRQALHGLLEAGYAHQHMVAGITQVMRHAPSTVYAQRSKEIRISIHALIVSFLESRGPVFGPEFGTANLELAADVMLAQCEGLSFLGRVPRSASEQVEILTDVFCRYLESFGESDCRRC